MGKKNTKNSIAERRVGDNQELLLKQEIEQSYYFTPQQLKEYNEINPEFGKKYLDNIIEIPREVVEAGKRSHTMFKIATGIALLIALIFLGLVSFLFYCGEFKLGTGVLISSIAGIIGLFIKAGNRPT